MKKMRTEINSSYFSEVFNNTYISFSRLMEIAK